MAKRSESNRIGLGDFRVVAISALVLGGWALVTAASAAHASDGVVEINHARAQAGGITSGDASGYPVSINESGSYRLTGTLTIPGGTTSPDTDGIVITANDVTLDLNGFMVTCQRSTIPSTPCANVDGAGIGILMVGENIQISGGTVRDMASYGVFAALGTSYTLEGIRARNNRGDGFHARPSSMGRISRSIFWLS